MGRDLIDRVSKTCGHRQADSGRIKLPSETVKNPDPDSFRPQNQRSRTQNPQQTRPQPPVERGWADKADSRPPLRGPGGGWGGDWYLWHAPDGLRARAATGLGCVQAGAGKLGVIEASYASAISAGSWNESGGRNTGTPSPPECRRLRRWRGKILCGAGFGPEPLADPSPPPGHRPPFSFHEPNRFLPARRRPSIDHLLVARSDKRQGLQTCRPDDYLPQCRLVFVCPPVSPLRESTPRETGCLGARHGSGVRYDEWRYTRNHSPALAKASIG